MDLLDPDLLLRDLLHGAIRAVTTALITRLLTDRRHATLDCATTDGGTGGRVGPATDRPHPDGDDRKPPPR
ncbi:hypothetical protein AB0C06_30295 [Micromonospora inaquosa]|uniref:hypothetical protein n=1 Tax=Micromonospora inaquosa TaxID=2203716 RepID=UPI0033FB2E9A